MKSLRPYTFSMRVCVSRIEIFFFFLYPKALFIYNFLKKRERTLLDLDAGIGIRHFLVRMKIFQIK